VIGYFPTPYPDELFYSICGRFSSRADYPSAKSVFVELFGTATVTAVIDLPNQLENIAVRLPEGTSLAADIFIDRHTLLPFFSPFLPPERVEELRRNMRGSSASAAHMRSGIMASRIPLPSRLRYCPACKVEDGRRFRETYWHRLHQIPGIEVCATHEVFLEDGDVSRGAGRNNLQFVTAKAATRSSPAQHIDTSDRDHQVLLRLARDSEWLLGQAFAGSDLSALHNRYLNLLIARGLATHTGSIHVEKLLNQFRGHYSHSLLKRLNCEFTGSDQVKSNWLLRLVRPSKQARHPLYHLLLIQFLGCTVEEFFQLPEELSPFGRGPWPCLNPAASHYRQPVIIECQLGDRLRYGKPIGQFSCECGFAYVRTGPDSSPEDRLRVGRTISFGQVWEAKLKQLWRDSSLSVSEIARRLGVDPLTVRRYAARMELSLSRSDKRLKPLRRAAQLKGKTVLAAWEKKRHRCCSKWLSAMKSRQKITLKALRRKLPREYAWLRQNDSEWLDGHKPRPERRKQPTTSVDWKKRDAHYAAAVKAAASRLKDTSGRPVQVTRTAIGRVLGATTLLRQKLHKMPLTARVLEGVVEKREQYAVRRVWWAADLYYQERVLPREWQLVMRANVYSLRDNSAVECAVEGAMSMLTSKLPQGQAERAAS
jgi:hypothetical protein